VVVLEIQQVTEAHSVEHPEEEMYPSSWRRWSS
jgi:hypothetical protein